MVFFLLLFFDGLFQIRYSYFCSFSGILCLSEFFTLIPALVCKSFYIIFGFSPQTSLVFKLKREIVRLRLELVDSTLVFRARVSEVTLNNLRYLLSILCLRRIKLRSGFLYLTDTGFYVISRQLPRFDSHFCEHSKIAKPEKCISW